MIVLDVETTGFARHHEVWEVGLVVLDSATLDTEREWSACWLPEEPPSRWDARATEINGLLARDRTSACLSSHEKGYAIRRLHDELTDADIVAHGTLDERVMRRLLASVDLDAPWSTWWDSVAMARRWWPRAPRHTLDELLRYLDLPSRPLPHRALDDARALVSVLRRAREVGVAA